MADRPILSVDASGDESSTWFAMVRADLYGKLTGKHRIDRLGGGIVDRSHLMRAVRSRPYRAIVISSHGSPGIVHDAHNGVLLSEDDSRADLGALFKDRIAYLCCCRSMLGALPDKLLEAGACVAIGFEGEPSWEGDSGRRIWADFDREILLSILEQRGMSALLEAQSSFLARIEATFPAADETFQADLANMQAVLQTMVIRGREAT
jgi:hypothetical protein